MTETITLNCGCVVEGSYEVYEDILTLEPIYECELPQKYKIIFDTLYDIYCSGSPDDPSWQKALNSLTKIQEMETLV